ncbi:MAG: AmmeMemoRadiSam system protein B [Chloroflexi bacterium]|nr:AmmeMemoRadiSam system protein B [Chloroflexota bacterium]
MRDAITSGAFYPDSKQKLLALMDDLFHASKGFVSPKKGAFAAYLPHAGYAYSGALAAATLSCLEVSEAQVAIIIGTAHTGEGAPYSVYPKGSWCTPFGETFVAEGMADYLIRNSKYFQGDTKAHDREHSVEVQVPLLQYLNPRVQILPIVVRSTSPIAYEQMGEEIAQTVIASGRKCILLASGDMTHYEPVEQAETKDRMAIEAILKMDVKLLNDVVDENHVTMCGVAPASIVIAAARALGVRSCRLVGYATSADYGGDKNSVVGYAGLVFTNHRIHPLAELAEKAVWAYVLRGERIHDIPPHPDMKKQNAVFVSIKRGGNLRGCIGTILPQYQMVGEEIISNAIAAATQDPRFPPVKPDELPQLDFSVDVLTTPTLVQSLVELDPKVFGVIVESGHRRGLLLPDLEGVDTVEQQLSIARQKGGIGLQDAVKIYRFSVERYK